jgi:SSS family solute:Na+ symporter
MLSTLDYLTVLVSLVVVIFVALRASRSGDKSSGAGYFLAGRDLTWPFVGMSLFMTNISAMHVIGLAGDAHRVGLVVAGYELDGAWDLVMLAAFFAPLYLKSKVFTIPEFLERRFGWAMRAFLSANNMVMNIFTRSAIILWAGSLLFTSLFGWNQLAVMIVLSILTGLYTFKGGLKAVVYADMIQGAWLIAGSSVLTVFALIKVGGWQGLTVGLHSLGQDQAMHMVKPLNHELPITGFLISNFVAGLYYWCVDQTNVQRVLGARTIEEGQKGAIFAAFLKILPLFILVLPGVIARVLYPDLERHDLAFSTMVTNLLPAGLRGLVLAGVIATLMSSMSACYNSSATLVTKDFLLRWRPNCSDRLQVIFGRWVTLAMMVVGVLTAPIVGHSVTLWFYLQQLAAYLSVPLGAAIFLGLLWKRANTAGAITSAAVGFTSGVICFLDQTFNWKLPLLTHPYLNSFLHRSLLCWIITILVMVFVSMATPAPKPESVQGLIFLAPTGPWKGITDYRVWAIAVILVTLGVWWIFR